MAAGAIRRRNPKIDKASIKALSGSTFHSTTQIANVMCIKPNSVTKAIDKLAKHYDHLVEYRTQVIDGRLHVFFRLNTKKKYGEAVCMDEVKHSEITYRQFQDATANLCNNQFDYVSCLFDNRARYLTCSEIASLTGMDIETVNYISNHIKKRGFEIHARCRREQREYKLVGVMEKSRKQSKRIELTTPDLINRVFR